MGHGTKVTFTTTCLQNGIIEMYIFLQTTGRFDQRYHPRTGTTYPDIATDRRNPSLQLHLSASTLCNNRYVVEIA